MPNVGDTRSGTCTWCDHPVVQVWRLFTHGIVGGYWSEEKCPCGTLSAITGEFNGNDMKYVGQFKGTIHARKR